MQETRDFFLDTYSSITETDIESLLFSLRWGDRIFLIGDLGSGKSTLARALLRRHLENPSLIVRSPTYTYYQRYTSDNSLIPEVYHFDLYRVESNADLFLIGAMDILEDPMSICIIEWPELLPEAVIPTRKIHITPSKTGRDYRIETRWF
jgi:tRNA threonylcarbamoyl adenosine modification protein YjeE